MVGLCRHDPCGFGSIPHRQSRAKKFDWRRSEGDVDIGKANPHASMTEEAFVELSKELQRDPYCGIVVCAWLQATGIQEQQSPSKRLRSRCCEYMHVFHDCRDVLIVAHCDDFVIEGKEDDLHWVHHTLRDRYIAMEQRHQDCNRDSMVRSRMRCCHGKYSDSGRLWREPTDRPDIKFCTMELCRSIPDSRKEDKVKLKHLGRYLKAHPQVKQTVDLTKHVSEKEMHVSRGFRFRWLWTEQDKYERWMSYMEWRLFLKRGVQPRPWALQAAVKRNVMQLFEDSVKAWDCSLWRRTWVCASW